MLRARKALAFFVLMLVGSGLSTWIGGTSTLPQETETVQMIDNGGFELRLFGELLNHLVPHLATE